MTSEIFILNYNGREILAECLPSIWAAANIATPPCPVTVIDNRSSDDSVEFVKREYPGMKIILTKKNTVLCAFNDAVKDSRADVVFLLNNDLKADRNFIAPLLKVFEDHADAFLAGPKTFTFDGERYEGSLSKMFFKNGFVSALSRFTGYEAKIDTPGITMQSGFGAYRRDFFLKLGGFDDLYLPGTVEDTDICFRAWKSGYRCYYEPTSKMLHKGQATFGRHFKKSRLLAINQRNIYLFIWKNITDAPFLLGHFLWLLIRPIFFLLQGRYEFLWGFVWALTRLPHALARRARIDRKRYALSDQEVFAISERV